MSGLVTPESPSVLLATDFSEPAAKAAEVARAEALRRGARLYVLHVVRSPADAAAGLAKVNDLAARLGPAVPAAPIARVGAPAAEIVRYAEEQGIDLIVLGGHGRTGATRTLLGSVAERVARTSTRPVLVVPHDVPEAAKPQPAVQRCVVCGTPSEDLVCEPCRANIRAIGGAAPWTTRELGPVGELDRAQCEQVLRTALIGRLACHAGGRLYVVPMAYAYDDSTVYLRSAEGTKVRMMRENPEVCLQVDHIRDLSTWRSVIVWGTFRELAGAEANEGRQRILRRLSASVGDVNRRPAPSQSGLDADVGHRAIGAGRGAVVGVIEVSAMTGRYQQEWD